MSHVALARASVMCIVNAFFSLSAWATVVVPMNTDELVSRAPVIVHGRVVQIEVDPRNGLRTAVVEASEVSKGSAEYKKQKDFYVPLLERALPRSNIVERVLEAPDLRVLEEVVLFLKPIKAHQEGALRRSDAKRIFSIMGFHQGKLRVLTSASGERFVASWNERFEKRVSALDLKKQKSTQRLSLHQFKKSQQAQLKIPLAETSELKSLDFVLNKARASTTGVEE